jgi:hypothetical protein
MKLLFATLSVLLLQEVKSQDLVRLRRLRFQSELIQVLEPEISDKVLRDREVLVRLLQDGSMCMSM